MPTPSLPTQTEHTVTPGLDALLRHVQQQQAAYHRALRYVANGGNPDIAFDAARALAETADRLLASIPHRHLPSPTWCDTEKVSTDLDVSPAVDAVHQARATYHHARTGNPARRRDSTLDLALAADDLLALLQFATDRRPPQPSHPTDSGRTHPSAPPTVEAS